MKEPHSNRCSAPICPFDATLNDNLDTWCWYPSESVCQKGPRTHIQKVQKRIQKLYLAGKIYNKRYFTSRMLRNIKVVKSGIEGINPNRRHSGNGVVEDR